MIAEAHNKSVNVAYGWTTLSVASPQGCPLPWRYVSLRLLGNGKI